MGDSDFCQDTLVVVQLSSNETAERRRKGSEAEMAAPREELRDHLTGGGSQAGFRGSARR